MHSVVAQVLLASEPAFLTRWKEGGGKGLRYKCSQHCYHLLGVDIIFDANWAPRVIEVNGEPSMKPAVHESFHSPYNRLKHHMTEDLVALIYGSPEAEGENRHEAAVGAVSRQLATHRVGVVGVDCETWEGGGGGRHDSCVGEDVLEYLLRSEREHIDRGGFFRLYPRPTEPGNSVDRLLAYIKQVFVRAPPPLDFLHAGAAVLTRVYGSVPRIWPVRRLFCCDDGREPNGLPRAQ